ncbi:ABC transporter substrate-binding protein [Enhydrobacter sp.]|jgi:branched-chain amino acid transport system substrate-binding protein|uniref:ABC transporter substrate-binding protein n=1 Tax=Enhydrobacter sp. TaxID=1894999 RepID=UPI00262681C5|nr:ABC transporter substrate-binding protein [Enhydrobacter sp.]WIM14257.1 MAG: ABC transporter, substrate-binding protein (cluster 4, leucine/isoleucine/valine/benzoate) [Enhydrobacter sp.]
MLRRDVTAALAALALAPSVASAQDTVKVGLILPMTGQQASTGKQIDAAVKLYQAQNGTTVAGKKVEVILKDDTSVPDVTKRLAQELVVNDKVAFLAGFGITPSAFATAPIATQAKVPEIVMAAGTSSITEASPYIARTSFTLAQSSVPMAQWAYKNGIKKVVTLVSDYGPGIDAEKSFSETFKGEGGTIVENLRVPMRSPDFSPVLQKVADARPDALFVFVPSGTGAQFVKQFVERGLDKSGVKLIATGDVTDDDQLNGMGDVMVGVINAHNYSANHDSAVNRAFVAAFKKANNGMRPNFMAVGGYDGMHLIYAALKKTNGNTDGDKLMAAIKGMAWESPRGPISIDPQTRDIVQNIYIRKVGKVDGELYNVEFETIPNVKDPVKAAKKK